ncbi:MAG: hypothetical protein ACP5D2_00615 [Candidatus Nanoarchaeia archaeon]
MEKRGQFFILAAVIISLVILSFGFVSNSVIVSKEPESFYDYSHVVRKETGNVVDYQIYSGFSDDVNLSDFVDKMSKDLKDKDPEASYFFLYGNSSIVNVRNYGFSDAAAGDNKIESGTTISSISFTSDDTKMTEEKEYISEEEYKLLLSGEDTSLDVRIEGEVYKFPLTTHKKVILLREKEVGNESFVYLE